MKRLHTYGQHFLRNPRFVESLLDTTTIGADDTVYDLGAGSGVITAALAGRCQHAVAVELEQGACQKLRGNMAGVSNVTVLQADILRMPFPDTAFKIFSNIPFAYSAAIVRRLSTLETPPTEVYLIVQKQFAEKLRQSKRQFTSQLGAELGPWWTVRIVKYLQQSDFSPQPKVATALVELKLRDEPLLPVAERQGFAQFTERCYARQKYFAGLDRARAGINPERKPSELTTDEWVRLYKQVVY